MEIPQLLQCILASTRASVCSRTGIAVFALACDLFLCPGRFEGARADPMADMTDEQKEHEAMKLMNAMDKLQRLGVVQPSTIGADGTPVPVEHVLQLAQDPTVNSENNEGSEDSD